MPHFSYRKTISIFANVSVNDHKGKGTQSLLLVACGVSVKTKHPLNCEMISKSEQNNLFIFAHKYLRNYFHVLLLNDKFISNLLLN